MDVQTAWDRLVEHNNKELRRAMEESQTRIAAETEARALILRPYDECQMRALENILAHVETDASATEADALPVEPVAPEVSALAPEAVAATPPAEPSAAPKPAPLKPVARAKPKPYWLPE